MSDSLHSAMNDVVLEDAARMSGHNFAEARAGGIGRQVRTRRTVRAAGWGGGTLLTAGALAVGATQVPWNGATAPVGGGTTGVATGTSDATADSGSYDMVGDSPFECGFTFNTDADGTEHLGIDGLEWSTPNEMNARIADRYSQPDDAGNVANPRDVPHALGTFDVPTVTVHDTLAQSVGNVSSGVGGTADPALGLYDNSLRAEPGGVVFAEGTTFVAVVGDVVVGTLAEDVSPQLAPSAYFDPLDESTTAMTMLNADGAFVPCPAVDVPSEWWDAYAVAGSVAVDSSGTVHGPDYAWLRISGPEDGPAHLRNPTGTSS